MFGTLTKKNKKKSLLDNKNQPLVQPIRISTLDLDNNSELPANEKAGKRTDSAPHNAALLMCPFSLSLLLVHPSFIPPSAPFAEIPPLR